MSNLAKMRRTLSWIEAHPDLHDPSQWMCGTTACFAGWTVLLEHGSTVLLEHGSTDRLVGGEATADLIVGWRWADPATGHRFVSSEAVLREAQHILGLSDDEQDALFRVTAGSALAAVNLAAAIIARDEGVATSAQYVFLTRFGLPTVPAWVTATAGGA